MKKVVIHRSTLSGGEGLSLDLPIQSTVEEIKALILEDARAKDAKKYKLDFSRRSVKLYLMATELVSDNVEHHIEEDELAQQAHIRKTTVFDGTSPRGPRSGSPPMVDNSFSPRGSVSPRTGRSKSAGAAGRRTNLRQFLLEQAGVVGGSTLGGGGAPNVRMNKFEYHMRYHPGRELSDGTTVHDMVDTLKGVAEGGSAWGAGASRRVVPHHFCVAD